MDSVETLRHLATRLQAALGRRPIEFDRGEVVALVDEIVARVGQGSSILPSDLAAKLMETLRAGRSFNEMERLGEALEQSGVEDAVVRTLYAQALIDNQKLSLAQPLLLLAQQQART